MGVLVFVPSPFDVEVVATTSLDADLDVETEVLAGLDRLVTTYRWGREDGVDEAPSA